MSTQKIIDAHPTKEFFISMLVRDIGLKYAIGDLVDNCIDGAKRLRGADNYENLFIKLTINENEFIIEDNCGGIDLTTAEKYAFRFGRPSEMGTTQYSIGQFGIGMKRALFKIGNKFTIDTNTLTNSFSMDVNVNEWKYEADWIFNFNQINEDANNAVENTGTKITITELHEDIKNSFLDPSFISQLKEEIEYQNLYNINKKISISINNSELTSKKLNLKVSDNFKVGKWDKKFENDVEVKIIVGIGDDDKNLCGWYIFCNDRLIIGANQSKLTGWGDGVAKYHGQYDRFRGFVFFKAEDSSKLPWNTTKTGMNEDLPIFKTVRQKMIEMMKPVINGLLNPLKQENESSYIGSKILQKSISEAITVNFATKDISSYVSDSGLFMHPVPDNVHSKVPNGENRITYFKPTKEINQLKKILGVSSVKEVGERTFEYTYNNEVDGESYE